MIFSIFDNDETLGNAGNTLTVEGSADGVSTAFSEGFLEENLRAQLRRNGFGVRSVDVNRPISGGARVTYRVVFDWACNDVNGIAAATRENVRTAFLADHGTVIGNPTSQTGCSSRSPAPTERPPVRSSPNPTNTEWRQPPGDPPPKPPELTWEEWFEKYKTPIMIGGAVVILLARR